MPLLFVLYCFSILASVPISEFLSSLLNNGVANLDYLVEHEEDLVLFDIISVRQCLLIAQIGSK